jgi:hypothetical protein
MKIKIFLVIVVIFFHCEYIYAQNDKQYQRELKKFLQFIRDSEFAKIDTLKCRNYLSNKNVFNAVVLYGTGKYGLSDSEKKLFLDNKRLDTNKFYLPVKMLKRTILVSDTSKYFWSFSKPIFLRSYLLCAFSYVGRFNPDDDEEVTFLYKKEKGKWQKLFSIGRVANY